MTYELIDNAGNTVASFENFEEAWDAWIDADLCLILFDKGGHAVGAADKARFV